MLRPGALLRGPGESGTSAPVDNQAAHGSGKCRRIAGSDKHAGHFRHDDLTDAATTTGYDWQPTRLRLE